MKEVFLTQTPSKACTQVVLSLLILVVMLGHVFLATAQTTYGNIVGTVVDPTGLAVPEVAITVTNDDTGVIRTTTTGVDGNYLVDKLLYGQYTVAAEKTGFTRFVNSGVTLLTTQSLRVNITLTVGAVTEEITVTAQASLLETESGEVGFVRGDDEIENLPVITPTGGTGAATFPTRDPLNYVFSMPGAGVARATSAGKMRINGALQGTIQTRVDGSNMRDNSNGIGYGGRPNLESTAEVKVIGINSPAEYDMQATVLINTKPGGNEIHGGVGYDGQQRAWNAADFFLTGTKRPFNRRNAVWAHVGGPIIKDKLFYYGSWDLERTINAQTLSQATPLPAFKTGDFSALMDPTFVDQFLGGTPIEIVDPLNNGAPFPGNMIPADRINSVSRMIQDQFFTETPRLPGLGVNNPFGVGFPIDTEKYDLRIDYHINDRHRFFSHFNYGAYSQTSSDGAFLSSNRLSKYPTRQFNFTDTYSFSPTVINEFKGGFFRYVYDLEGELSRTNPTFQEQWGIQGIGGDPGLPFGIAIGGFSTISSLPPITFTSHTWELLDNLTFIKGKHTFKTGFAFNRPRFAFRFDLTDTGSWNFSNRFTGYSYADFLLGYPNSSNLDFPAPPVDGAAREYNLFFQDTWQATRNLTLNYGVRWQNHQPPTAKDDLLSNWDPATQQVVLVSEKSRQFVNPQFPTNVPVVTAAEIGFPGGALREGRPYDIAPRFGFAYRLGGGKTVLRGGYGVYFATYNLDTIVSLSTFGIYRANQQSLNILQEGTTIPDRQFPSPYFPQSSFVAGTGRVGYYAIDRKLPNPYTQQANLTLERAFGRNRLAVSYIGNYGKQGLIWDINQAPVSTTVFSQNLRPIDNFAGISFWSPGNIWNYSSLQVVGERRLSSGLFFRASYNWQSSLTRADNDNGNTGGVENGRDMRRDYGNSLWTPRHSATISYTYELPFGQGKTFGGNTQGVSNHLVGGWQINGVTRFRSGLWLSPSYSGYDASGTGRFGGRADRIGDGTGQKSLTSWFDASAFTCPGQTTQICDTSNTTPIGRFGTAARSILDGPGFKSWDFSIFKNFPIRESMKLQVRVEFTNLFNTPQFSNPAVNISDPGSVGRVQSTIPDSARTTQFGARFEF